MAVPSTDRQSAGPAATPRSERGPSRKRALLLVCGVAFAALAASAVWWWAREQGPVWDARERLRQADPGGALRVLRAAERRNPRNAEIQYLLAVANRRAGRLIDFSVHLRRAAELRWRAEEIERQEWLATAQAGNVPAVEDRIMELIEAGAPDDVAEEVYEAIAKGHMSVYRLRDAWVCLDVWLQWRPEAPQARFMRASIHEQISDRESAIADYRAVLQQHPNHRDARIRLAQALFDNKQFDEAAGEYETWLAMAPDDAEAMVWLAQCERRLGLDEKASAHVRAALQYELPQRPRAVALAELGRILLDEGKTDEAIDALRRAIDLAPMESDFHFALGTALARAGQTQAAQYHHLRMREIRHQFDRMTEITRRLVRDPLNADLRCDAGEILIGQGLKREGADWLRTALKCDPTHRKTHALLAEYYAELGELTLAAEHRLAAAAPPKPPAAPTPK